MHALTFIRPRRAHSKLALSLGVVLPSALASRRRHPVALFSGLIHAACIPPLSTLRSSPHGQRPHDSGPRWVATPFSCGLLHFSAPVYPDARRLRSTKPYPPLRGAFSRWKKELISSQTTANV